MPVNARVIKGALQNFNLAESLLFNGGHLIKVFNNCVFEILIVCFFKLFPFIACSERCKKMPAKNVGSEVTGCDVCMKK